MKKVQKFLLMFVGGLLLAGIFAASPASAQGLYTDTGKPAPAPQNTSVFPECTSIGVTPVKIKTSTGYKLRGQAHIGCNQYLESYGYAVLQYWGGDGKWHNWTTPTVRHMPSGVTKGYYVTQTLPCNGGAHPVRTNSRVHYKGAFGIWHWGNWIPSQFANISCR